MVVRRGSTRVACSRDSELQKESELRIRPLTCSDDSDESEEDAITPSRLAQLSNKPPSRSDDLAVSISASCRLLL